MDHPKRFDDLVTECTWTLMAGITDGSKLSALVRNIMSSTIEWKNGLDNGSPKPGFVNQLERLNETVSAENQRVRGENAQLKFSLQELTAERERLEHRLGEVAAERDKLKAELASKDQAIEVLKQTQGSLIQEIAAQRDKALLEKQDLQEKLDRELARSRLIQAALENTNPEGD